MVLWRVLDAFRISKGTMTNRNSPWCKTKAILSISLLLISICHYLRLVWNVWKTMAPPSKLIYSFIRGTTIQI